MGRPVGRSQHLFVISTLQPEHCPGSITIFLQKVTVALPSFSPVLLEREITRRPATRRKILHGGSGCHGSVSPGPRMRNERCGRRRGRLGLVPVPSQPLGRGGGGGDGLRLVPISLSWKTDTTVYQTLVSLRVTGASRGKSQRDFKEPAAATAQTASAPESDH